MRRTIPVRVSCQRVFGLDLFCTLVNCFATDFGELKRLKRSLKRVFIITNMDTKIVRLWFNGARYATNSNKALASIVSEASTSKPPVPARPALRTGPVPPVLDWKRDSGSKAGACLGVIDRPKP
jgi:hypothetical protein